MVRVHERIEGGRKACKYGALQLAQHGKGQLQQRQPSFRGEGAQGGI